MKQTFGFFVQWHLTDRCNLACRHCYQRGITHAEMTGDRIAYFVDDIRNMLDDWSNDYDLDINGSLQLTGGEPLLRDDLIEIIGAGRARAFETYLMTNGTLVESEYAKKLRKAGVSAVQVSIEGMPETHDKVRGPGSYDKAAAGIRALVDAGVEVTVNATLTKMNLHEIEDMARKTKEMGATRIGFARLVPEGHGDKMTAEMLSPAEVETAYRTIKNLRVDGLQASTRDPLNCLINEGGQTVSCGSVSVAGCAAGLSGVSIMPDGTVMPCRRMNIGIGNINETTLREIWTTSPVLNNLRDKSLYTGKCGGCEVWDICRGCRAVAYAVSKVKGMPDYLADDPQCWKDQT